MLKVIISPAWGACTRQDPSDTAAVEYLSLKRCERILEFETMYLQKDTINHAGLG
jgi:hypothetical protein